MAVIFSSQFHDRKALHSFDEEEVGMKLPTDEVEVVL